MAQPLPVKQIGTTLPVATGCLSAHFRRLPVHVAGCGVYYARFVRIEPPEHQCDVTRTFSRVTTLDNRTSHASLTTKAVYYLTHTAYPESSNRAMGRSLAVVVQMRL